MPLKLSVGVSRKVGLPEYSSVGASCHLELDLSEELFYADPDAFRRRVREAYVTCNQAVNDELAQHGAAPDRPRSSGRAVPDDDHGPAQGSWNGNGAAAFE